MNESTRQILFRGSIILFLLIAFLTEAKAQPAPIFQAQHTSHRLSERWELDTLHRKGTFLITPYKPVYITAGRWSDRPNEQPTSENPPYSLLFRVDYGN